MSAQRIAIGVAALVLAAVCTSAAAVVAQAQKAPEPKSAVPKASPPAVQAPPRPQAAPRTEPAYTYRPEGRRDPFLSLVSRGVEGRPGSRRAEGLAGLTVAEIALRGILHSRGSYLAMVQGPDTKTYIVHPNDRLLDGTVRAITADSLVILQEVNDPLSLTKQREVRKTLRALEEVK